MGACVCLLGGRRLFYGGCLRLELHIACFCLVRRGAALFISFRFVSFYVLSETANKLNYSWTKKDLICRLFIELPHPPKWLLCHVVMFMHLSRSARVGRKRGTNYILLFLPFVLFFILLVFIFFSFLGDFFSVGASHAYIHLIRPIFPAPMIVPETPISWLPAGDCLVLHLGIVHPDYVRTGGKIACEEVASESPRSLKIN